MPPDIPERQKLVAIVLAASILILVVELVRRRQLREEYSVLWILTAILLLVLALNNRVLIWVQNLIGAAPPQSALFFGGLVFLILLCLQFSVRLSRLTYRTRTLAQRMALLEEEVQRSKEREKRDGGQNPS